MAAWPTGEDLGRWIDDDALSAKSQAWLDECVAAATSEVRSKIDVDRLPFDLSCPPDVWLALLIVAGGLLVRRFSLNGIVAFGEFAMRVNRLDPTVDDLLFSVRVEPEP